MTPQQYTQSFENCRLAAYDDKTGFPLKVGETPLGTCTIGWGSTGPDIVPGLIWTQVQCDTRFSQDYLLAQQKAQQDLGHEYWDGLDALRQMALTDIAYEVGGAGLAEFHLMLQAVRDQNWQIAHDQCLSSKYAQEVPRRAKSNALIFLTGQFAA